MTSPLLALLAAWITVVGLVLVKERLLPPRSSDDRGLRLAHRGSLVVRLYVDWRDLWAGVYVNRDRLYETRKAETTDLVDAGAMWSVYVCPLPVVVLRARWIRPAADKPLLRLNADVRDRAAP